MPTSKRGWWNWAKTTNFFTFIATTNRRCTIAQRGKNKQKRHDLRQVGLALVVTQKDSIPLFQWSLSETADKQIRLDFSIDQKQLGHLD